MDKQEVTVLLRTIKLCYPFWYSKLSICDMDALIKLYEIKFARNDFETVNNVIIKLVDCCKYAPSIEEIKSEIKKVEYLKDLSVDLENAKNRIKYTPSEKTKENSKKHLKNIMKKIKS